MVLSDDEIQHRLLELIEAKGPFNWYNLEIRVPIDPGHYPPGRGMSYFLRTMLGEGLLSGSEDTKYEITDAGRQFLSERQ